MSTVERNNGLTADLLFVGATRPAVALGVPYAALLVNALVALELFLVTRNLLCLAIVVPIHGLECLACALEPRFFDLLTVWGAVRGRTGFGGRQPWGAVAYGPFTPTTPIRRRDAATAVVEFRSLAQ